MLSGRSANLFSTFMGGSTRRMAGDGGNSRLISTFSLQTNLPPIPRFAGTSPLCVCKQTLSGEGKIGALLS